MFFLYYQYDYSDVVFFQVSNSIASYITRMIFLRKIIQRHIFLKKKEFQTL